MALPSFSDEAGRYGGGAIIAERQRSKVLPEVDSYCRAGNPYDHIASCSARSRRTQCRAEGPQDTIEGHACARTGDPDSFRTTGFHEVVPATTK
jgi:hypothetical protein